MSTFDPKHGDRLKRSIRAPQARQFEKALGSAQYMGEESHGRRKPQTPNQDDQRHVSNSDEEDQKDLISESDSGSDTDSTGSSSSDAEAASRLRDDMKDISFGALAEAQDAVNRADNGSPNTLKRKRGQDGDQDTDGATSTSHNDEKLQTLRAHLASLRASKSNISKAAGDIDPTTSTPRDRKNQKPTKDRSDRPDRPSRTSKNAPAAQTSKRAVPRARPAIEVSAPQPQDPRFSSAVPHPAGGDETARKQYGFLRAYASQELAELKESLVKLPKPAKGADASDGVQGERARAVREERERLRREIERRENRGRAGERKEKERKVKRELRRKEREEVRQGKKRNPFFVKRGVVRDLVEGKGEEGGAADGEEKGADVKKMQKKEQRRDKKEARKDMKRLSGVRERRVR
ncbi:MAG: rRNA biogenesis protein rrp36 [Alyxoria varia]|nr:MAG: rRNA biogenesis protein rrp36 [Alyxoria varia]